MESIGALNKRLIDYYGLFEGGEPNFRLTWSDSETEKRLGTFNDFTSEGIFLRTVTEVREVPKYRQWIHHKWILERLTVVPELQRRELADAKVSYEPLWVFEDKNGKPLPPKWEAIQAIINFSQPHESSIPYQEELGSDEERIIKLQAELFGNESEVADALAYKEAITVPTNYEKN